VLEVKKKSLNIFKIEVDSNSNFALFEDEHYKAGVGIARSEQRLATCWMAEGSVLEFGWGQAFLPSTSSRPVLGPTQPHIHWVRRGFPPEVKRPRREAEHAPPTFAEVNNTWISTSTPPYFFMALYLTSYAQEQLYLHTIMQLPVGIRCSLCRRCLVCWYS
jgi:hypothetical protein